MEVGKGKDKTPKTLASASSLLCHSPPSFSVNSWQKNGQSHLHQAANNIYHNYILQEASVRASVKTFGENTINGFTSGQV